MMDFSVKIRKLLIVTLLLIFTNTFSQINQTVVNDPDSFWKKVQWGGGFGLGFGNRFTNISLSPMGVYPLNERVSVGAGVQMSYLEQKDFYSAFVYGGSLVTLFNPIQDIQLSLEFEQLRINRKFENPNFSDNFWNTAMFLGAGYRTNNTTIGVRYNVLFRENDNIYGQAWMPFVRILF